MKSSYQELDTNTFLCELYGSFSQAEGLSNYMYDDFKAQEHIDRNWEAFSESEIDVLHKYFTDIELVKESVEEYNYNQAKISCSNKPKVTRPKNYTEITKMRDEWYYIEDYRKSRVTYYKCDQFDGLLSFLDSKISKKSKPKIIKSFENFSLFESVEEDVTDFDAEDYLDYLASEVDEKDIYGNIQKTDNLLYIELDIDSRKASTIERYMRLSIRFKDVITISKYDYDMTLFRILIVDRFFYSRNQNCLYKNINWGPHPIFSQLKATQAIDSGLDSLLNRYDKSKMATGLPDGVSMTKDLDRIGAIEIWSREDTDDPIHIWEDDIPQIQFYLFKYLGK